MHSPLFFLDVLLWFSLSLVAKNSVSLSKIQCAYQGGSDSPRTTVARLLALLIRPPGTVSRTLSATRTERPQKLLPDAC